MSIREAKRSLLRGLRLRCPVCGIGRLYESLFKMNDQCSACGLVFRREQGYFVGAIYINVLVTNLTILIVFGVSVLFLGISIGLVFLILFCLAIAVPLIFFRHSRGLWLGFDCYIDPPGREDNPSLPGFIDSSTRNQFDQ
jgi:uncharacterized protein (DUF983 family)